MIIVFSRGREKRKETTCAEERKFFNGTLENSRATWTVESLVTTGINDVNSSGMSAFINSNVLSICWLTNSLSCGMTLMDHKAFVFLAWCLYTKPSSYRPAHSHRWARHTLEKISAVTEWIAFPKLVTTVWCGIVHLLFIRAMSTDFVILFESNNLSGQSERVSTVLLHWENRLINFIWFWKYLNMVDGVAWFQIVKFVFHLTDLGDGWELNMVEKNER